MDSTEISRLCASMTLLEKEGPVRILGNNLKMAALHKLSVSLVGKILSKKVAFMRVIDRIWHVKESVVIKSLSGNVFSFMFKDMEDRSKVLSGAPWSFDNDLLVLEEPDGKGSIEEIEFSWCDFWVQIFQVPLLCNTREIGCFLGEMIGKVVEVDGDLAGDSVGKFLRVRVRIDITKPL
ncbi:hypothetical protein EZV62_000114 [Acer yangbiense]|uniref:DUF4283 domain-containing protein n=1 Tax=Acer yangbiense TaxID=1000413 RepID=A0A5C7IQL1_9ROSI|nr:hypothetical protein EZV62_000114 [Acer yangbiense]